MTALSLQIWNALRRPPIHHPLFRRVSRSRPLTLPRRLPLAQRIGLLLFFAILLYVSLRYYTQVIFVAIVFIPLGLMALYMVLHGTIAGVYWAVRVSSAISRERDRGMYDLLSTSPYGSFSVSWAICTGCQYYDQTFNGIGAQRVWYSRFFFLTLLFLSAAISLADPRSRSPEGFLQIVELVVILAVAFHSDDIQSTVIGSLVGLIVPLFSRHSLDTRIAAFIGFLLLQVGAYSLILLIGFVLLPQVNMDLGVEGWFGVFILPIEQFAVFFAVRELVVRILWRLNSSLHDGDVSDLGVLSGGRRLIC
jgi:hypothetical protein